MAINRESFDKYSQTSKAISAFRNQPAPLACTQVRVTGSRQNVDSLWSRRELKSTSLSFSIS